MAEGRGGLKRLILMGVASFVVLFLVIGMVTGLLSGTNVHRIKGSLGGGGHGEGEHMEGDVSVTVEALDAQRHELDAREVHISEMEEQLKIAEQALRRERAAIEQLNATYERAIAEEESLEQQSLQQIVGVYTAMRPEESSVVFESMDRDLAIEILAHMKDRDVARILENMKPELAASFTSALRARNQESQELSQR